MAYSKQDFKDGDVLYGHQLNNIEDGIVELEDVTGADKWDDSDAFTNYPVMSDCLNSSYNETGFNKFKENHNNKSMAEVIDLKANKTSPHLFTIPITGWSTDSTIAGYTNYIDIAIDNLTDQDSVDVTVLPQSTSVASSAQFTNTQTFTGVLRLRAKNIPTAEIEAQWRIVQ